jgi:hypothetical protein
VWVSVPVPVPVAVKSMEGGGRRRASRRAAQVTGSSCSLEASRSMAGTVRGARAGSNTERSSRLTVTGTGVGADERGAVCASSPFLPPVSASASTSASASLCESS